MSSHLQQMKSWVPIAYEHLQETAGVYNRVTTYQEVSALVQKRSGVTTKSLMMNWIGTLLGLVAQQAKASGDAPLTSLCVRSDGTIGDAYVPASGPVDDAIDLEMRTAEDRLECYRRYATNLPADGGIARLTPQVTARRERASSRVSTAPKKDGELCPTCYMAMSMTGECGTCDF